MSDSPYESPASGDDEYHSLQELNSVGYSSSIPAAEVSEFISPIEAALANTSDDVDSSIEGSLAEGGSSVSFYNAMESVEIEALELVRQYAVTADVPDNGPETLGVVSSGSFSSDEEYDSTTDDNEAAAAAEEQEPLQVEQGGFLPILDLKPLTAANENEEEEDDRGLLAAALYVERRRRNVRWQNFFGYFRRDRGGILREIDDTDVPGLSVDQINDMNFDTSLPERHQYLGDDMEVNSGRTVRLERDIATLPFIAQSSIVLLPKQSIPMYFNRQRDVALFRSILAGDKTFVLLPVLESHPHSFYRSSARAYANFGTVAEVVMSAEDDDQEVFKVVAEGRERCEVLEHLETSTPDGVIKSVRVRILPDNNLPYNMFHSLEESFSLQSASSHKLRQLCQSTRVPVWVVCLYDVYRIMRQIRNVLSQLFMNESGMAKLSEDPSDFSFLVASFLPLSHRVKYKLLSCGCALQRLNLELQFLKHCQYLFCVVCKHKIASISEIIVMSNTGALATFVNPGGIIYETLTLNKICGKVTCVGIPQTENSWFPGYAWTPASCSGCHCHLGWLFTRARSSAKTLKPERFWGISNNALCPEGNVENLLLNLATSTS